MTTTLDFATILSMSLRTCLQNLAFLTLSINLLSLDFEVYFNFDKESKKQDASLKKKSDLFLATSQTYNSFFAIRNQAEEDAKNLAIALKAQGYLDAKVSVYVHSNQQGIAQVMFEFHSGPRYSLKKITFNPPFEGLSFEDFLNQYVDFQNLEQIEEELLDYLNNHGYMSAFIESTRLIALADAEAEAVINYKTNKLGYFGKVHIQGLSKVKASLVEKKINWKEGDLFNASYLKALQKELLETELFTQVTVKAEATDHSSIPILIELTEAKFKSVSVGVNLQTHFGVGGDLSFEHRNLASQGQKLSLDTSVTQNSLLGKLSYQIPDFYKENQTLKIKIEATRESLQPSFSDNLYEMSSVFQKEVSSYVNYDIGLVGRYYLVQHSVQNGHFATIFPYLKWRYDTTFKQLDPKQGFKVTLGLFYYQNINTGGGYSEGTAKGSFFYSFFKKRFTWAQRVYLGSFFTNNQNFIPVPLRFFGGTDEYLRGYKYYTVSPLDGHKPLGGTSCLFLNSELRITIKYPLGAVLFYDSGFVSDEILPTSNSPYYQSVGFGFRYYAFFGPLRLDVGFPLNPRKSLDSKFKILATFGHTF